MNNEQVVLARRPNGKPVADDFQVVTNKVRTPGAGEALIKNEYISLDAGFRNWMDEDAGDEVLPAMPLFEPVMGLVVGRVIQSENVALQEDSLIMGRLAWEQYSIATDADFLVPIPDSGHPTSYHLGVLSDTGMSAYFGLTDIGDVKPGETVLISAAGGAVGSIAGQIARILGAGRVVGFAGNEQKCARLKEELGYDEAINYRAGDVEAVIAATCPDGVDVYFDNVGGELLVPVLNNINHGARIPFCGAVADYTRLEEKGPGNLFQLVTNCARLEGFLTHTKVDRYDEARNMLSSWLEEGKLKSFEAVYEGVSSCGVAFSDLFAGKNFGKTLVKVS